MNIRKPTYRVSVVIATNRPGPFLDEALASIDSQTLQPVDVILVDDGSGGLEKYLGLSNIGVVTRLMQQPAMGVSIARNRGLMQATGELVAFLDDDDRWPPNRLEAHARAMAGDPSATVSVGDLVHIDEHGEKLFMTSFPDDISLDCIRSREVGVLLPCCVVRRDQALLVGGFNPALLRVQDFDFILNLLRLGGVVRAQTFVEYRTHDGNATARHREVADFQLLVAQLHRTRAHWAGEGAEEANFKAFEARARRFAGWSAQRAAGNLIAHREYMGALREALWLVSTHPSALSEWGKERARRALRA